MNKENERIMELRLAIISYFEDRFSMAKSAYDTLPPTKEMIASSIEVKGILEEGKEGSNSLDRVLKILEGEKIISKKDVDKAELRRWIIKTNEKHFSLIGKNPYDFNEISKFYPYESDERLIVYHYHRDIEILMEAIEKI